METAKAQGNLERAGIDLAISGEDLMLSGRFSDWEAGVSMGPDLDQMRVRIAVDATSASSAWAAAAARPGDPEADSPLLFSFRGREVSQVSAGVYQVTGELAGPVLSRIAQLQVETPIGHSAMFMLSFDARKSDFGPAWTQLLSNVVPFRAGADGPAALAHAWMTVPELAAA
jgi:polyisoprenoid-binding protein YceI